MARNSMIVWGTIAVMLTAAQCVSSVPALSDSQPAGTAADQVRLMNECERKAFDYFIDQTDPWTGLTRDRASNFGPNTHDIASSAASGFALAALAVGVERGWISRDAAAARATTTLTFFRNRAQQEHGWFYHFMDVHTGKRAWTSEISSIDTALLLAGALLAGHTLGGTAVPSLADEIYRRVDFPWMLTDNGDKPNSRLLCHGWKPESGFIPYRWDSYSELMILYLLAMGSPTHPIPASCWDAWRRPEGEYAGFRTFKMGPLFTFEFSQAFVDFRGRQDRGRYDYWSAAVNAVKADRQFCIDHSNQFHTYGPDVWGLSACDGPDGYRAYGAPPGSAFCDGTAAPLAVVASIALTPDLALASMQHVKTTLDGKIWGRYGFSDAFNIDRNWFDQDVIGIDLGCALLMLENERSAFVWKQFMGIPEIQVALDLAGLRKSN